MCDGMGIDRRLTLLGVMLVVLSMTMATQYVTTKVGYRYSLVHPSEADVRFIGSDNASGGARLLRVNDNTSNQYMILELGNWTVGQNKSYTAAFGIVNEEPFSVNITHINISGTSSSHNYMYILLHSNRQTNAWAESAGNKAYMWNGSSGADGTSSTCKWKLGAGDGNKSSMSGSSLSTPWDDTAHVRYSTDNSTAATNGTSDFVWVQITIDIPQGTAPIASATGQIWIHFKANTL